MNKFYYDELKSEYLNELIYKIAITDFKAYRETLSGEIKAMILDLVE